jgi:hypothetical protein
MSSVEHVFDEQDRQHKARPQNVRGLPAQRRGHSLRLVDYILHLQRTIGNQAVGRLLREYAAPTAGSGSGASIDSPHAPGRGHEGSEVPSRVSTCPIQRMMQPTPLPVDTAHQRAESELWEMGANVTPVPLDFTDLTGRLGPVGAKLGVTGYPQSAVAPSYSIEEIEDGKTARIAVTARSVAPNWDSYYLAPSPPTSHGYEIGKGKHGVEYLEVPQVISDRAKHGEQEHCDDYSHAYTISLQAVDTVMQTLNGRIVATKNAHPARTWAKKLVGDTLNENQLGWMGWKAGGWMENYRALNAKSKERDTQGWHDFTSRQQPEGGYVVIRIKDTTAIGVKPTTDLIKPG